MKTGAQLIAAERKRQLVKENWTPEHDDKHRRKELAKAASSYLNAHTDPGPYVEKQSDADFCHDWPWSAKWWKPSDDPIRNLVKAGALIAAEIDRLQRRKKK